MATSLQRRTPHYLRIYGDLKSRIDRGLLAPGGRLPTQRDLAKSYGVTVMTVRHALQLLEHEELVALRHGLGTFVAPRRLRYGLDTLSSLSVQATAQGLSLGTRVLGQALVPAHPHVVRSLELDADEKNVLSLERLRLVDDEPIVYQTSYLPARLCESLASVDLAEVSLYDYLHDELGLEIARAQESVQAVNLPARPAQLLDAKPRAAALLSERVTFSSAGKPVLFDRAYMPGHRISVSTDRVSDGTAVGYRLGLSEEAQQESSPRVETRMDPSDGGGGRRS